MELLWILLAEPVQTKKSHASVPFNNCQDPATGKIKYQQKTTNWSLNYAMADLAYSAQDRVR